LRLLATTYIIEPVGVHCCERLGCEWMMDVADGGTAYATGGVVSGSVWQLASTAIIYLGM
jgi:hypothetical protein